MKQTWPQAVFVWVPIGLQYRKNTVIETVLRIRIRRIRMFLGLLNPNPDPLVEVWIGFGSGSFYR
jgi:hypothetical protein